MNRRSYLTDLTTQEWNQIAGYFVVSYAKGGRPAKYEKKELLNAIFYILRTGCQWRYLPHDFPPWTAIYKQYQRWKNKGIFEKINCAITKEIRLKIGRNANPSSCIADSQSVKTTEKGGSRVMMVARR
jgi:putative transposase